MFVSVLLSSLQALHEECPILMQDRVLKAPVLKSPLQGPTLSRTGLLAKKLGCSLEMEPNR